MMRHLVGDVHIDPTPQGTIVQLRAPLDPASNDGAALTAGHPPAAAAPEGAGWRRLFGNPPRSERVGHPPGMGTQPPHSPERVTDGGGGDRRRSPTRPGGLDACPPPVAHLLIATLMEGHGERGARVASTRLGLGIAQHGERSAIIGPPCLALAPGRVHGQLVLCGKRVGGRLGSVGVHPRTC